MKDNFQIAIDGPIGSGKSTVAKKLAEQLGFTYIDTGAMYRAVSLICLREGWRAEDEERIVKKLERTAMEIESARLEESEGKWLKVRLNGEEVTKKLYTRKISDLVAEIAALPRIRQILVEKQQAMAREGGVIMEGRDIGTRVLPEADLKIYLDAREATRAERRFAEIKRGAPEATKEEVAEATKRRDNLDRARKESPLRRAEGAWYLDSSELSVEEVVKLIVERVNYLRKPEAAE